MMSMQRRTFLLGALFTVTAPLVCKAESLMRLRGDPTKIVMRSEYDMVRYLNHGKVKHEVYDRIEQIADQQLREMGLKPHNRQLAINLMVDAGLYCPDTKSTIEEMRREIARERIDLWPAKMPWEFLPRELLPVRRIADITRYIDVVG